MGSAASIAATSSASLWTPSELRENEQIRRNDKYAMDHIVQHMYYGMPLRYGKQSADPR